MFKTIYVRIVEHYFKPIRILYLRELRETGEEDVTVNSSILDRMGGLK